MKLCNKCLTDKPESDFYKNRNGTRPECKNCFKEKYNGNNKFNLELTDEQLLIIEKFRMKWSLDSVQETIYTILDRLSTKKAG